MSQVELIPSPVLQDQIIQTLQQRFSSFYWLEACYPMAQVGIKKMDDGQTFRMPTVYTNAGDTKQIHLFPDSHKTSFGFFEMESPFSAETSNVYDDIIYELNFVAWLNLPKIDGGKPYDFTMELIDDVITALKSYGVWTWSADTRNESVFSKYDYDQSAKQFMLYPYSGFKINFEFRKSFIC